MDASSSEHSTEPEIEFLILADHAEAVNGKLYMMGGGLEHIGVVDFQSPVFLGLAVGILVPWNATNREHQVSVTVQNADAVPLAALDGQFNVGRPPTIEVGGSQRTIIAAKISVTLSVEGTYVVVGYVNGHPGPPVTFRAVALAHHGIGYKPPQSLVSI